ncbi:aldo/keto reductase [Bacillus sp. UFRGS-B20]|nr:aldo/keto reductase [Bacillus sp. UFRGS-B20]
MFFKVRAWFRIIDSVKAAIKNGYRSIDYCSIYQNEEGVGTIS